MIIEFNVFSKDYNEKILNNTQPFDYICPKCGARAKFHRHGTYDRFITSLSPTGEIVFETLTILRLKCQSCTSTHSILPGDIIPFQIYSLSVVLFLCQQIFINKVSLRKAEEQTKCSIRMIYQKLYLLKYNLTLIEFYFRQIFLYNASVSISLVQALTLLLLPEMDFMSYFHCHGHPIFINRRNTISYPLYFTAAFS